MLIRAIDIANRAHRYQTRRVTRLPYIVHPLNVMAILSRFGYEREDYLTVAVLHDVIEDCLECFADEIHESMPLGIVLDVHSLTKWEMGTIVSIKDASYRAQIVKCADIIDNADGHVGPKWKEKKIAQLKVMKPGVQSEPIWEAAMKAVND